MVTLIKKTHSAYFILILWIVNMVLSQNKIAYYFYSLIIYFSYIQSVNIVSMDLKWVVNKLFYIVVFSFIFVFSRYIRNLNKYELISLIFLFLFLCFFTMSNIQVFVLGEAIVNTLSNGILYFLIFLIFLISRRILELKDMLKPFVISSSLILIISILVYLGLDIPYYFDDVEALDMYLNIKDSNQLVGFSGIYLNQNSLSAVLLFTIAILISYYNEISFFKKNNMHKYIIACFIILSFLLLFLTISRSAILAAVLLVSLYFLKGIKSKRMFYSFVGVVILSLSIGLYFINVLNFLIDRVQNDGSSHRTLIWADALSVFRSNYVFGVGVYKYETMQSSWSAHNVYIHRLVTNGIFAAFFWYAWLALGLFMAIKKIFVSNFFRNKSSLILYFCFISILTHQIFESMITNTFAPITLAVFLTMSIILINKKDLNNS